MQFQHRSNKSISAKDQYNGCSNLTLFEVLFRTAGMGTTRGEARTQGKYCSQDLPVVLY